MNINIVLIEPEIPQNTGNIARTCAAIGATLHLVKPLGFDISEKAVKRSGLDYWDKLDLKVYENLEEFENSTVGKQKILFSTKAHKKYTDINYMNECYLIFGPETRGLPEHYILNNMENTVRIPMLDNIRSLNLSNSVAIAAYEVLRQSDFKSFVTNSSYFENN